MKLLALDTSVAVHLIASKPKKGQEEQWRIARQLTALKDYTIALPTPVVGELLAGVPASAAHDALEWIQGATRILAYDLEAAKLSGGLWIGRCTGDVGIAKQCLKVDFEIVATAVRWKVQGFCTTNPEQLRALARISLVTASGEPSAFLGGVQLLLG